MTRKWSPAFPLCSVPSPPHSGMMTGAALVFDREGRLLGRGAPEKGSVTLWKI